MALKSGENGRKLVIVESPAKAKTINKILGSDFKVAASVGHIIDLPKTKFGVDIENGFKPQYVTIPGKGKIIKELKEEAKKSQSVYLATDPDREGEAIAYHIAETIRKVNPNIYRVEFNEITKNAVLRAVENPHQIDMNRVNAQQARRVMDRIVGYQVSPLLWQTIYRGLSAGRVQSVALRLICEREEEIEKFQPVEYWTVDALLRTERREEFRARLVKIDGNTLDPQKFRIANKKEAEQHRQALEQETYVVDAIEKKTVQKKPPAPFITSTLQQEASRRFRMTTSRIMAVAQQLYEGIDLGEKGNVGLITYMRTDSTRISTEAISAVREYIGNTYGPDYVPAKPNVFGKKKSAQDAHEAIRPTYLTPDFEPRKIKKYLTSDQFKIYQLIWQRFLACQMKPARVQKTVVRIKAGRYEFRAEGEVVLFRGYMMAYQEQEEGNGKQNGSSQSTRLPADLQEQEQLELMDLNIEQRFTQPPPRYTESTLVKTLDKLGIGRPSTYAQIISTLLNRKYVEKKERTLHPTDLGKTVNRLLVNHFPDIFNVKFTARMEENLDKVERNESSYLEILRRFYIPFEKALKQAQEQKQEIREELQEVTDIKCDVCGRPMVVRWGRNGKFLACSGYPECKNTRPLEENEPVVTDEVCELCGAPMVIKRGRFGEFLACSNYPKCKNTRPISTGVSCPEEGCDGVIVQRQSRRGKIFYSCSNYPKCKFALWDKPVAVTCPQCGYPLMVEKVTRTQGYYLQCPKCKHKQKEESLT